jgi:hypothetical protein
VLVGRFHLGLKVQNVFAQLGRYPFKSFFRQLRQELVISAVGKQVFA